MKVKNPVAHPGNSELRDIFALIFATLYMWSVLTVAHHISLWRHNGTGHTAGRPAVAALIFGLILIFFSWRQNKKLTGLNLVSLTVFATASIFWLSGLRANFF